LNHLLVGAKRNEEQIQFSLMPHPSCSPISSNGQIANHINNLVCTNQKYTKKPNPNPNLN
jgi:hypothetical protein